MARIEEIVIRNDAECAAHNADLSYPGTFVIAQGHSWVVYWNTDGDEIWMRPPNEDDSAPIGQTIYADDAEYPYTYVVRAGA